MAYALSVLILLLLCLGAQPPYKSQQCYVPICGTESNAECPFIAINLFSGKWTTSWAESVLKRPVDECTSQQMALVFKRFLVLETKLGTDAQKDGNSIGATGPMLLQHYLLAWVNWVVESVPEDWLLRSELSLWLTLMGMAIRTALEVLVYFASNWVTVNSVRNMLQDLASVTWIFSWAYGLVKSLFWWIRGSPPGNSAMLLEEKNRNLELQVETLQNKLEQSNSQLKKSLSKKESGKRRRRKR